MQIREAGGQMTNLVGEEYGTSDKKSSDRNTTVLRTYARSTRSKITGLI